jgi:hypothetical protein
MNSAHCCHHVSQTASAAAEVAYISAIVAAHDSMCSAVFWPQVHQQARDNHQFIAAVCKDGACGTLHAHASSGSLQQKYACHRKHVLLHVLSSMVSAGAS